MEMPEFLTRSSGIFISPKALPRRKLLTFRFPPRKPVIVSQNATMWNMVYAVGSSQPEANFQSHPRIYSPQYKSRGLQFENGLSILKGNADGTFQNQ
jgi:hypothetical protein